MPPPPPAIVYTDVGSVAQQLSSNGIILRADDNGTTSGVISNATLTAPIQITSTNHLLNTGDLVQIQGVVGLTWANGMWFVTVIDANTFSLNGSNTEVGLSPYVSGGNWMAVTYPQAQIVQQSCYLATGKVNRFCQALYDSSDLVNSWSVWTWATIIAAHWMCARRNNPIPRSLNDLYAEAIDELMAVQKQEMQIEDLGYRNEILPLWSALRMDRRWNIKQLRADPVNSARTPTQFPRKMDFAAQILGPVELNSMSV